MAVKEFTRYQKNIKDFIKDLNGKEITRIFFFEEIEPAFKKEDIPFEFIYAFTVVIETGEENFWLHTSSTPEDLEAFWIEKNKEVIDPDEVVDINEVVESVESVPGFDDYSYKIIVKTANHHWFFYAAEIYAEKGKDPEYAQNDMMILCINGPEEAEKLDNLL